MKEALYHIEAPTRIVFRETFESEQSVRRNGGTPTDVTFSKGAASFNGTSSRIDYPQQLVSDLSVSFRAIVKYDSLPANCVLFDHEDIGVLGSKTANLNYRRAPAQDFSCTIAADVQYEIVVTLSNLGAIKMYLDGVLQSDTAQGGFAATANDFVIGALGSGAFWLPGEFYLFEIYNCTLTATEVSNLHENRRFRNINTHGEQLGSEMIPSPFVAATWNASAAWVVNEGVSLSCDGTTGSLQYFGAFWDIGKRYRILLTINRTSGTLTIPYDGSSGLTTTSSGLQEFTYSPDTGTNMYIYSNSFVGTITSLSIKEILAEQISEILNVSAQSGTITDRQGNTLTKTNTTVFKYGEIKVITFNSSDSKIDCGDINDLDEDVSIAAWMYLYSFGEGSQARILDNGKLIWAVSSTNSNVFVTSDGATIKYSANNVIDLNKWIFVAVTRTSAGLINHYINGEASGTVNQDAGTPEAGTTNIVIGNNNGQTRTFDGFLGDVRVCNGILPATEISQMFSNERNEYGV
jgi:hypothetical protein